MTKSEQFNYKKTKEEEKKGIYKASCGEILVTVKYE